MRMDIWVDNSEGLMERIAGKDAVMSVEEKITNLREYFGNGCPVQRVGVYFMVNDGTHVRAIGDFLEMHTAVWDIPETFIHFPDIPRMFVWGRDDVV